MCVTSGRGPIVDDFVHGKVEVGTGVFILSSSGVSEYDRAKDYLRTPVLSIADVELLHTRFTQSVKYSDIFNDVDCVVFKDCVTCNATADEEEEENHRAC